MDFPTCIQWLKFTHFVDTLLGMGKQGTLLNVQYTHDGKKQYVKHLVEKIDDKNLSTTFKVEEGDILDEDKSFKYTVQASPKGSGSLVHWNLEYEKKSEDTPDPHSMLEYCVHITKDTDAHLSKP